MVNSLIPIHDILANLHPNELARHPYILYPSLTLVTLVVGLLVVGAPLSTPFTATWQAVWWLVTHPLLTALGVLAVLGSLSVVYRRQVVAFYKTVFLPPTGEKLPKPFSYETIELSDAKWFVHTAHMHTHTHTHIHTHNTWRDTSGQTIADCFSLHVVVLCVFLGRSSSRSGASRSTSTAT